MIDTTALLGQPIVINVSEGVLAMSLTALQEPAGTIMIEIQDRQVDRRDACSLPLASLPNPRFKRCSATDLRSGLFHMNRTHVLMISAARSGPIQRGRPPRSRSAHPGGYASWSPGGTLDWWVKDRQEWWGRVRSPDGHQRWVKAADLRRPPPL